MSNAVKKDRPEFRNIHVFQIAKYRLPLAGLVSILHRISGLLMFVLLPLILYFLDRSLLSEGSFAQFQAFAGNGFVRLIVLALVWAYLHHLCAGVRHLLMDTHIGLDKDSSRHTSIAVFAVSLPLTLAIGLKLFGAF